MNDAIRRATPFTGPGPYELREAYEAAACRLAEEVLYQVEQDDGDPFNYCQCPDTDGPCLSCDARLILDQEKP